MISQLNLFRFVEGDTVVHRADARPKVLGLTLLIFGFSFSPGWAGVAIVWALAALLFGLARLPLSVLPRPPRILLIAMALALFFGLLSGGEPLVGLAGSEVGLGGILLQLRLFAVTLGLLLLALLIGWTTPAADLPRAAAWMLTPFRWFRLPVDELVAALTVAVRALPLVADEFATVTTLWRARPDARRGRGYQARLIEGMDIAATITSASVRRATELGEAMANRGPLLVRYRHPSWRAADGIVAALLVGATTVIVWGPW